MPDVDSTPVDNEGWTEGASDLYRQLAMVAVPARAEQIATLLTLMPFSKDDTFRVVELASGEGFLAHAILSTFSHATLLALDGSETMQQATAQRLAAFGSRATVADFDMYETGWFPQIDGADVAVSSLCVHHLDGAQKKRLFRGICERLSRRGALLLADLILPQRQEGKALFAATWDRSAQHLSREQTGSDERFQFFQNEHWNYYRYPDPFDKPSPLFDQLLWLREAGFAVVDCFWMQAGHAIYGGYKSFDSTSGITFTDALQAAQDSLS